MSDEIKETEVKECNCFCHSKEFRKFLTIALGTFVGVFCALSLFAALQKPPMVIPAHHPPFAAAPCPCHRIGHFDKGDRFEKRDFHKMKMVKPERKSPFEEQKAETDD